MTASKREYDFQLRQIGNQCGAPVYAKIAVSRPGSARLRLRETAPDHEIYEFVCPGCGETHAVDVGKKGNNGWNQDIVRPRFFLPLIFRNGENVCEMVVRDGVAVFTSGCSRNANKILALEAV